MSEPEHALRISRLEREVAALYQHLGIAPPQDSAVVSDEVRSLVSSGNKIHAIKLLREQQGLDLADAKRIVDEIG
jgi:ribosomal protein L7/L12